MLRRSTRLSVTAALPVVTSVVKSTVRSGVKTKRIPTPPSSSSSSPEPSNVVASKSSLPSEPVEPVKKKRKTKKEIENDVNYDKANFPARLMRDFYVGAHVSAAGGPHYAIINAAKIGCNAFAFFTRNQRAWKSPPLAQQHIDQFKQLMTIHGYSPKHILPHGSYLVNLAQPDETKWKQAYEAFEDEVSRCEQLGLELFNFHPGSSLGLDRTEACQRIAKGINAAHKAVPRVKVCIESMCGSGNQIGGTWEEIAMIIDYVIDKDRVGVVIDTCHSFAAGYDIRTKQTWDAMLEQFDRIIGLRYFSGMHLNDSKGKFESHVDRHEGIGSGEIGMDCFKHVMQDQRCKDIPLILETPGNVEKLEQPWVHEISLLYALADGDQSTAESIREKVRTLRMQSDTEIAIQKLQKKAASVQKKQIKPNESSENDSTTES